jgi:peptidoglycan/xylan/chitin deacetylase (PgdA/CDA1 family)
MAITTIQERNRRGAKTVARNRHGGARETLVVCYHAVSDRWSVPWSITPSQLREQLELLVGRGYQGRTFSEAVTSDDENPKLAITFDDAWSSVLDVAYPILSALGLVATVFVVTDFADTERPLKWLGIDGAPNAPTAREVNGMTWPELAQLADHGWEIGSHTRTHPHLTELDDATLAEELRGSREACERALRRPCLSLAYPYGDFDHRVVAAAAEAGYEVAATLPAGMPEPSPLAWPRIGVYHRDSLGRFRLKVSPTLMGLRRTLAPIEHRVRAR